MVALAVTMPAVSFVGQAHGTVLAPPTIPCRGVRHLQTVGPQATQLARSEVRYNDVKDGKRLDSEGTRRRSKGPDLTQPIDTSIVDEGFEEEQRDRGRFICRWRYDF